MSLEGAVGRQSTFSLPSPRAEQLRKIAEHQGISVGEVLDQFIVSEWRRLGLGRYGGSVPGFHVSAFVLDERRFRLSRGVLFSVGDYHTNCTLKPEDARLLAQGLEGAAAGGHGCDVATKEGRVVAERRGRGVVIVLHRGPQVVKAGVTPSIALDLSQDLRAAADEAEA